MSCPIIITNTDALADLTLPDLSEITIAADGTANITDLFSIETIANSTDLANAIANGDATLTYAGEVINQLDELCITPTELSNAGKDSYRWAAGRRRNITANGIDLIALDRTGTANMPFIALTDCEIKTGIASSRSTTEWTLVLLKSTDNGANWVTEKTENIDSQTKVLNYVSAPIALNQGEMLRTRYVRNSSDTLYPQINLLIKEI